MTVILAHIIVIVATVIFIVGLMVYADYQAKLASHARWAKREQARLDSRRWFEERMAQEQTQEQTAAAPVASLLEAPHNAGRRRILRLE